MFKVSKTLLVVESVEKAVKFYTEKLGFALSDVSLQHDGDGYLSGAEVKKGNCILYFRVPAIEELAEFGMVKRCVGRSAGIIIEMNRGLEKYFKRCKKKSVPVVAELSRDPFGRPTFSVRDPFGLRLVFVEQKTGEIAVDQSLFAPFNLNISKERLVGMSLKDKAAMEPMVETLRGLGLLRRVSQRFVRGWVKMVQARNKKK